MTRHNWLTPESTICALLGASLLALGVFSFRAAYDTTAHRDLTLGTLAGNVRDSMGQGDKRKAKVVPSVAMEFGIPLAVDTIAFLPAAERIPSTHRGGFLADQVASFNRAQRRSAWRQHFMESRASSDEEYGFLGTGPIIDTGRTREVVFDPSALAVPSPLAERAWRTVRAIDSRSFNAFLRPQGTLVPQAESTATGPAVRDTRWCTAVERVAAVATDIYCGALIGLRQGKYWELRYWPEGALPERGVGRLRTGHSQRVWVNGSLVADTLVTVRAGDLVHARLPGPMIPTRATTGLIAGTSIVNGERRFFVSRGPLRDLAIGLARNNPGLGGGDTLRLALHEAFSQDLDSASRAFVQRYRDVDRIEIVVADVWSGGIRALAGRSQRGELRYLPGFEPAFMGSLVKPFLAAAILSQQPELSALEVISSGSMVTTLRGIPVHQFAPGPTGRIDLAEFLRQSSNQYAAELLFTSLERSGGGAIPFDTAGDVSMKTLEVTDVAVGFTEVFDVYPASDKSREKDWHIWSATADVRGTVLAPVANHTYLWPWDSQPFLFVSRRLEGQTADSLRGASPTMLSRFAYGQGYHEWTLVGAAQAFARSTTGRRVWLGMPERSRLDTSAVFPWRNLSWAAEVRRGLRGVVETGTAAGLGDVFVRSFGKQPVVVYGKTGSALLDEKDTKADRQTLGLLVSTDTARVRAPDCGIVVALSADYVNGRPASLRAHTALAAEVIAPLLVRHWAGLQTCRS